MTITALEYIHKVLIKNEQEARELYHEASRLLQEYEEHGADQDLIDRQAKAEKAYREEYFGARGALQDFEDNEW